MDFESNSFCLINRGGHQSPFFLGNVMTWQMIFFIWGLVCAYVVVRGIDG